ncbi:MAG: hypothetical protein ABIO40_00070 [Devosia sp.]
MTRTQLYGIAGMLAIIVVVLAGYLFYEKQTKPGLEIRVDRNGIEVNGNG